MSRVTVTRSGSAFKLARRASGGSVLFIHHLTTIHRTAVHRFARSRRSKASLHMSSRQHVRISSRATTTARLRPRFSFPAFVLGKHERQNYVVQHIHPRGVDFQPRLPFPQDVICAVEFSDHCLLPVGGDQLCNVAQR